MKKFDVEFKKLTDNKYPFVRFVRAEYSVSDKIGRASCRERV